MDIYDPVPVQINSDADFAEFLEKNKKKIPEDVIVERVESGHHILQNSSDEGTLVIPAYALSLGLYLPLNPLISEILSNRGLKPIQLVPNCWRIMFSIVALNQYFCKTKLGWKEFSYCYVVKKYSTDLYYFSPRKKKYALVENLPDADKGWKDVYISLKGNWGGASNENISGEPAGADYGCWKPRDRVNLEDLEIAWFFENKDWKYLLDPANWRYDGAAVAGSSLLIDAGEEVPYKEVIINSIENTPGGETGLVDDRMTTNVSQPHSKKQRTNHDSGSAGVAHDDHHTPDTRVCRGQEAAGPLLGQARSLVMAVMSFVEESQNKIIKELEAKNKRLEKELAEFKLAASKEPAVTEHEKSPTVEQFKSLTNVVKAMGSDVTENTKISRG